MHDPTQSQPRITTELDAVGGETLAGSGFETETPEANFVSSESEVEE